MDPRKLITNSSKFMQEFIEIEKKKHMTLSKKFSESWSVRWTISDHTKNSVYTLIPKRKFGVEAYLPSTNWPFTFLSMSYMSYYENH